jgi:hypothetical protein
VGARERQVAGALRESLGTTAYPSSDGYAQADKERGEAQNPKSHPTKCQVAARVESDLTKHEEIGRFLKTIGFKTEPLPDPDESPVRAYSWVAIRPINAAMTMTLEASINR